MIADLFSLDGAFAMLDYSKMVAVSFEKVRGNENINIMFFCGNSFLQLCICHDRQHICCFPRHVAWNHHVGRGDI